MILMEMIEVIIICYWDFFALPFYKYIPTIRRLNDCLCLFLSRWKTIIVRLFPFFIASRVFTLTWWRGIYERFLLLFFEMKTRMNEGNLIFSSLRRWKTFNRIYSVLRITTTDMRVDIRFPFNILNGLNDVE